MMDKKPKKELIDGIKDILKDIDEPYHPREWEHFQRQRKGRKRKPIPLFIKLAGIAASMCLIVYASVKIIPFLDRSPKTDTMVKKQIQNPSPNKNEPQAKDTLALDSSVLEINHIEQLYRKTSKELKPIVPPSNVKWERLPKIPVSVVSVSGTLSIDSIDVEDQGLKNMYRNITVPEELQEIRTPSLETSEKPKRLKLPNFRPLIGESTDISDIKVGLNVNPAFSNKGFSFGGGVSAKIPLSTRISAEVGANYSSITVGTNMDADIADTINQQTIGIRHTVGMVSTPVSLNYAISESFSVSLGITPFKAVRERRTEILQSYRWDPPNLPPGDTTRRLVSERNELRQPDSLYKNNTYLGFVQLSGRISPPFLRKYNTVLAPYIAIPVGKLRNDQYQWLNGGVSIRMYLR